jgi:hypothetical protein
MNQPQFNNYKINSVVTRHVPIHASDSEAIRITLNQAQGGRAAFLRYSYNTRRALLKEIIKQHHSNRRQHRIMMKMF